MYLCREIYRYQELLEARTVETECLILLDKTRVPEELDSPSNRTLRVSALVMKRLSQLQSTESTEAIALMKFPTSYIVVGHEQDADCRKWFPAPWRILVLEGIQVNLIHPKLCDWIAMAMFLFLRHLLTYSLC